MTQTFDFFFYGTLVVPAILVRVLGHKCKDLSFQDAVLEGYTRHAVKGEDYPAIISISQAESIAGKAGASETEGTTRGTLVKGLSIKDVHLLDIFEGNQYARKILPVQVLSKPADIDNLPQIFLNPVNRPLATGSMASLSLETTEAQAWVYVWTAPLTDLEAKIWSFHEFMSEKASLWTGTKTTEYEEVDRQRAVASLPAGGEILESQALAQTTGEIQGKVVEGFEDFGHNMLKYWAFDKDYVNLNHGSYGSPPIPVIEAMHAISAQIESNPDKFMRRSWLPLLNEVRTSVAGLIGAETNEVVIVPNATHGINTILSNLSWADGDVIVMYSTTYGAIGQTLKYVGDRNPQINLEMVEVTFPISHSEIVRKTEEVLDKYNVPLISPEGGDVTVKPVGKGKQRVKMVVVDSIASNPGVIYPWEDIVGLCKRYGVLSLVDAAHSIGQLPVDVKKADCDFWVSNCHKWLMSHRGGSVMYVPYRNQHLVRSTFPTSAGYVSARYPTQGIDRPWTFVGQYEWTGTTDWGPFMSITPAIAFRKKIGGEERITRYCHNLAVRGGKRIAERWGTDIMENPEGTLTANMVNIALPNIPSPKDLTEQFQQLKYLEDGQFAANVFAPPYRHGGRWWIRFSAQVWNEIEDFDKVASVVEKLCLEIKDGKHVQHEIKDVDTLHGPEDIPTHDE